MHTGVMHIDSYAVGRERLRALQKDKEVHSL